jgi:Uma2 family endonuclease
MAIALDPPISIHTPLITADEFALLPDSDGASYVELIEGEVIVEGGAADIHQMRLLRMMSHFLPRVKTGTWRIAPLSVRLDDHNVFEPDIFWISPDNTRCTLIDPRTWRGAPDLVIEILSPSTQRRDRDKKFHVYESSGVTEYWLVDPIDDFLEVYRLNDQAKYVRVATAGVGESFESRVLALTIDVDLLFKGE